jgi:hypothetical protein
MTRVKMVLVVPEGVLGYIVKQYVGGAAKVRWFIDGLGYEVVLEEEEYVVKFEGEIDG